MTGSPLLVAFEKTTALNDQRHSLKLRIGNQSLWFELPDAIHNEHIGDAAVCAALPIAMRSGRTLVLESNLHLSHRLHASLNELQAIYHHWYPELQIISIEAQLEKTPKTEPLNGSFFSGGVDSFYTLLSQPDIENLIYIEGLDIQLDNVALLEQVKTTNLEIASHYKKSLLIVRSNIRYFMRDAGFSWLSAQGAGLSAIGHLIGLNRIYIPASNHFDYFEPLGSHFLTDPLWSSESVQFCHHGTIRRIDKLARIAQDEFALNKLRVCWMDNGYNCGHCIKCVRTLIALEALGKKSGSLPTYNEALLRNVELYDESEIQYLLETLEIALKNKKFQLAKIIRQKMRPLLRRRLLNTIDNKIFKGLLKKTKRRISRLGLQSTSQEK